MNEVITDNGLKTRAIVFEILVEVLLRKNPLDQTLTRHKEFDALEGREKNLARMIVSTALRRKGQLDDLIKRALNKNQILNPPELNIILYIGICQIVFLNIPDHAAVDTSVQLAEDKNMARQKGLVNAVLRRMTTEGKEWIKKQDEVTTNIPDWLMQYWLTDYDEKTAFQIAQASLVEADIDITLKNPKERIYWAGELEGAILPTGTIRRVAGGNITELKGYDEGEWWVQDAAAALPVKILEPSIAGKTVIDLCAAPGGKTAQLVAAGANVIAVDRSAKRLERLKENMQRLKLADHVAVTVGDGAVWLPAEPVDVVLLDAPCTATGTLRRHPDVMHLKSDKDIKQLTELQERLLENAAKMIKPDGVIVYCTCSLQKAEGEFQIKKFLATHPDFERAIIKPAEVGGSSKFTTPEGDVRIYPFQMAAVGGIDGFFIARLRRK